MTTSRLSLERIAEAARTIDPVFLHSPAVACAPLARAASCSLTLKIETLNPIRSFKGRGADFFVRTAVPRGPLACASAGNFGQAMAYACRARGIALTVFAARSASAVKLAGIRDLGADVTLAGDDFDSAKLAARAWADARGAQFVEDGREPAIAEGAGSIAVELGGGFDAVVVPVGDGALIGGIARWLRATVPTTRVIGACSRGAPAMHDAWRSGSVVAGAPVATIADGIAVRAPIDVAVADLRELVDDIVLVDDTALVDAIRLVHLHAGLVAEPSAVAGLAAIVGDRPRFAGARVATIITGGNVGRDDLCTWLCGHASGS